MLKESGKVVGKRGTWHRGGESVGPRHEGHYVQGLDCRDKGSQGWFLSREVM